MLFVPLSIFSGRDPVPPMLTAVFSSAFKRCSVLNYLLKL